MSVQSLIKRDVNLVKNQNECDIKDASDKYMYHKRFALGCNYNKDRYIFDSMLYDILHTDNCDILDLLEAEIEGDILKLQNKNISPISQYSLSFEDLYNRWLEQGNTGNFDFFLDVLINGGVTLEKNSW